MKEKLEQINKIRTYALDWIKSEMRSRSLTEMNNIRMWTEEGQTNVAIDDNENDYQELVMRYTLYACDRDGYFTLPCELNRICIEGDDVCFYGEEVYEGGEYYIEQVDTVDILSICQYVLKILFDAYDKRVIKHF